MKLHAGLYRSKSMIFSAGHLRNQTSESNSCQQFVAICIILQGPLDSVTSFPVKQYSEITNAINICNICLKLWHLYMRFSRFSIRICLNHMLKRKFSCYKSRKIRKKEVNSTNNFMKTISSVGKKLQVKLAISIF